MIWQEVYPEETTRNVLAHSLRDWAHELMVHQDQQIQDSYFAKTGVGMCAIGAAMVSEFGGYVAARRRTCEVEAVVVQRNFGLLQQGRLAVGPVGAELARRLGHDIGCDVIRLNDNHGVTFPQFATAIGAIVRELEESCYGELIADDAVVCDGCQGSVPRKDATSCGVPCSVDDLCDIAVCDACAEAGRMVAAAKRERRS